MVRSSSEDFDRNRPTSPRSPGQTGYAERLIGSIRTECLDHVVVFSERHLRHLMQLYMNARIYSMRRMRQSRAMSIAPGTYFVAQSWAGCITNMPGFNLRRPLVSRGKSFMLSSDTKLPPRP
jgi:hypothetical protein